MKILSLHGAKTANFGAKAPLATNNFNEGNNETTRFTIKEELDTKVLISNANIMHRIKQLAWQIDERYNGATEPLELLCILKGAKPFCDELSRNLKTPHNVNYIKVSSYEGTKSSGHVKIEGLDTTNLAGKNVLIVEDIIDSGKTLKKLTNTLAGNGHNTPKDIKIAVLLDKFEAREEGIKGVEPDFTAFRVNNEFVIGYGLDYGQHFRNLNYIAAVKNLNITSNSCKLSSSDDR